MPVHRGDAWFRGVWSGGAWSRGVLAPRGASPGGACSGGSGPGGLVETPPPPTATAAGGTHPTGMQSVVRKCYLQWGLNMKPLVFQSYAFPSKVCPLTKSWIRTSTLSVNWTFMTIVHTTSIKFECNWFT